MSFELSPLRVSRESVRQIALTVDRYEVMKQRYGRRAADTQRGPRAAGVITTRPLERVEMDHFLCDVHLMCETKGVRLGRPWLTLVVDHYSGMVLGYYLSFAPPSAASVLAALRHAILPKESSPNPSWPAFGIADLLVVDNGLDLTSCGVREACAALGIDLLFTPPRSPWYKGVIERFGRTMNTRFIHFLPGTTLGKPTSNLGYNGADEAVLTFPAFESLLEKYITTIHNKTPNRNKAHSPERLFLMGCQNWPVRVPSSMAEFDAAVALSKSAVLQQSGLWFLRLQYQNDMLGALWNCSAKGTRLQFKVNPLNLQSIQVRHPVTGDYFRVDCVDDYQWPRTMSMHLAVRAHARKQGLNTEERRQLAKAEIDLMKSYADAAKKSSRALRRMQAELLRQSQEEMAVEGGDMPGAQEALSSGSYDAFDAAFADD